MDKLEFTATLTSEQVVRIVLAHLVAQGLIPNTATGHLESDRDGYVEMRVTEVRRPRP